MAHYHLGFLGLCIVGLSVSALDLSTHRHSTQQHAQVDPSFQGLLPIEWVHVPKSGTSFLNNLLHIPGVCSNLPDEKTIQKNLESTNVKTDWNCDAGALDIAQGRLNHDGIERLPKGGFIAGKGRFMIMLRQPEQRLLSEWVSSEKEPWMTDEGWSFDNFVKQGSGCAVKMLTRDTTDCLRVSPVTRAEVDEAKIRLQTGFSFIGITDQWDLSLCLFNTMFNQACRSFQFQNSRPTKGKTSTTYDTTRLNGYRDPYDNELFDLAMNIFEANLKKYKVNESSCEACWREAGLLRA